MAASCQLYGIYITGALKYEKTFNIAITKFMEYFSVIGFLDRACFHLDDLSCQKYNSQSHIYQSPVIALNFWNQQTLQERNSEATSEAEWNFGF